MNKKALIMFSDEETSVDRRGQLGEENNLAIAQSCFQNFWSLE